MKIDTKDMLKSILNSLSRIEHIKPEDIPNIDLYMDQVTTFMDTRLSSSKRHPEDKNKLLPPPVKKKYSKEHLLVMIFIYYFKGILSITDIQALMNPITEKYFQNDQKFSIETIYNEVFSLEKSQADKLAKDIVDKYNTSKHTFENVEKNQEFLQLFSFICMLSFDVYVKKQMIEKLIDQLPGE